MGKMFRAPETERKASDREHEARGGETVSHVILADRVVDADCCTADYRDQRENSDKKALLSVCIGAPTSYACFTSLLFLGR